MPDNQPKLTYFSNDLHSIHQKFTITKQPYEKFGIT